MTSQTRATLKGYFNTNDQPTEAQFVDLIDSAVNVSEEAALFPLLAGRAGGQTLYGGTGANDDITIHGTSDATRTTSYVLLQPTAGNVGIGTAAPDERFVVASPGSNGYHWYAKFLDNTNNVAFGISDVGSAWFFADHYAVWSGPSYPGTSGAHIIGRAGGPFASGWMFDLATIDGWLLNILKADAITQIAVMGTTNYKDVPETSMFGTVFIGHDNYVSGALPTPRGTLDVGWPSSTNDSIVFGFESAQTPPFRIVNTRRANYANTFIGKNLQGVAGSDNYITPKTTLGAGYCGIEFRDEGVIKFYGFANATTANGVVTPVARMTIDGSGGMGINTVNTTFGRFVIASGTNTLAGLFVELPASANNIISQSGLTPSNGWKWMQDEATTGDMFLKRRITDVDYDVMYFKRLDGNMGLGTATPGTALHIYNVSPKITLQCDGAAGDGGLQFRNNTLVDIGGVFSDGATGGLKFSTYAKASAVWIAATTGNVGINDVAPAEKLDVTGNANVTGVYKVDDVQVLSNRVIDARCADVANSGDATTDGLIDALRDAMVTHGLIAAA